MELRIAAFRAFPNFLIRVTCWNAFCSIGEGESAQSATTKGVFEKRKTTEKPLDREHAGFISVSTEGLYQGLWRLAEMVDPANPLIWAFGKEAGKKLAGVLGKTAVTPSKWPGVVKWLRGHDCPVAVRNGKEFITKPRLAVRQVNRLGCHTLYLSCRQAESLVNHFTNLVNFFLNEGSGEIDAMLEPILRVYRTMAEDLLEESAREQRYFSVYLDEKPGKTEKECIWVLGIQEIMDVCGQILDEHVFAPLNGGVGKEIALKRAVLGIGRALPIGIYVLHKHCEKAKRVAATQIKTPPRVCGYLSGN